MYHAVLLAEVTDVKVLIIADDKAKLEAAVAQEGREHRFWSAAYFEGDHRYREDGEVTVPAKPMYPRYVVWA